MLIHMFNETPDLGAAQIKQGESVYIPRSYAAATGSPIVLGEGQLNWNRAERVSNRYGAVGLYVDVEADGESITLAEREHAGTTGQLRAVVLETREADHVGDLTHGWHVGGAAIGDVIIFGEGRLFFVDDLGPKVGVRPLDGSRELWLDGPALYRCHSQTVRLEFVPL